ncbi:MerR family transcriptional regulator [Fructobacillus ficulneus]|uniref:Transcriptional regulator n=1 Tax=Fructobacillus ficulneus TaxID=157463 RepID=A0A0K8MIC1_9LACO|nr:MerR family transcriptional regulator [Fructobacillus ficulneus]GAP00317.1 transcriptional regulator [Fructobacillus ficulneus]
MDKEQPQFKIKTVVEKTGLSEHTLRYYEKEGLVVPARTETNIRQYSQGDVEWLFFIDHMRSTDMSIQDLKSFVELRRYGTDYEQDILDILLRHRDNVQDKLTAYQKNLEMLNHKIDTYTDQLKNRDKNLYEYFVEINQDRLK